ncbi:MAG: hypothetical protein ACQCN3_12760 [Candidatus Bathyarchaeia archaeon]|jgi:hypothetical protein
MNTQKTVVVLVALLLVSLSVNLNNCQAVPAPAPEATTAFFQSFLTDVMNVNLTEYNITQSGYGTSYPSSLGGAVKEETISYKLDSGQGELSTWCLIKDGVITSCSLRPIEGQTFFTYTADIKESMNKVLQNYLNFASETYQKDTAYLLPVISSVEDIDYQKESEKSVEDMQMTVKLTDYDTTIKWAYALEGVDITRKCILFEFTNGSVSRFADTWNLYSVYDKQMISKEDAQSIGFKAAQAKPINMFSAQDAQPTAVQVTPDWNGWTCTANLNMIPGAETSQAIGLSNDTSSCVHGDPLTLYPQWHFVFYFGKSIGNVLGVEVGVWADNGEVAYSNVYGYLGGSVITSPEQTSIAQTGSFETGDDSASQSSDQTVNIYSPTEPPYLVATIIGAIIAVAVVSLVIVRKKNGNKQ